MDMYCAYYFITCMSVGSLNCRDDYALLLVIGPHSEAVYEIGISSLGG